MGKSVIGGVLGGGQELREAISDMLLKTLLLQNCLCHVIFFSILATSNVCKSVLTKHFSFTK